MKITKFRGLDNVSVGDAQHTLKPGDLLEAANVDIRNDGSLASRAGFSQAAAGGYANLWHGSALQMATLGADLVCVTTSTIVHVGVGNARMWYGELPDGRIVYSNGTATGVVAADGASRDAWGVPVPAGIGAATDVAGALAAGEYRWCITHRRTLDGLEGGPAYSGRFQVNAGGLSLAGLPVLAGHSTKVYVTAANGTEHFYAGSTADGTFTLTTNESRTVKCMTHFCKAPMPGGVMPRFWRGRVLLAVGDVLYATKARTLHLFNVREDFRRLAGTITMVEPVDNGPDSGIWVGTTAGLYFMGSGARFDELKLSLRAEGAVVRGSGARVPGESLLKGDAVAGKGNDGIVCIAGGRLTACYGDGTAVPLTEGVYHVAPEVTEVYAMFRRDGVTSQYVAVPQ